MPRKWRKRTFESPWVTEYPPGPNLAKMSKQKVYVTSSGFDDIEQILTSMNVDFEPFRGEFDCTLLFINCGTSDHVDSTALAEFVASGGCVYASDHADAIITRAFPDLFQFAGHFGSSGKVHAEVVDPDLESILGRWLTVEFDMGSWTTLQACSGEVLLRATNDDGSAGEPIMAYNEHGSGSVFFTCFHNKAQTSADETRLLQLLVVKQFSVISGRSMEHSGRSMGLGITTKPR